MVESAWLRYRPRLRGRDATSAFERAFSRTDCAEQILRIDRVVLCTPIRGYCSDDEECRRRESRSLGQLLERCSVDLFLRRGRRRNDQARGLATQASGAERGYQITVVLAGHVDHERRVRRDYIPPPGRSLPGAAVTGDKDKFRRQPPVCQGNAR